MPPRQRQPPHHSESHQLDRIESQLRAIMRKLNILQKDEKIIMADLSTITADVAANTDATQSAVTLLTNLKAELDAAGTDPVALKALSDSLEANTQALAAAVTANTPAA